MLFDLLFPKKCVGCKKKGSYFCEECLNKLCLVKNNLCPECGQGSIDGRTHPKCQKKYSLTGLTSVFEFKGVIAAAISKLKYRFVSDIADDLIEGFLSFLGEAEAFSNFVLKKKPTLIPVPLFKTRERWRGFNHAELLGKKVAQNLGLKFDHRLLLRIRETKPQALLRKKERSKNIQNAFALQKKRSALKQNLIIFDDVWTTGATIKECCRILKKGGAEQVWGLTLTREV